MANIKKQRYFLEKGLAVGWDYRPDQDYTQLNVPVKFVNHKWELRDVDLDAPDVPTIDPNAARIAQLEALSKSTITASEIAEYLALKGFGPKSWK